MTFRRSKRARVCQTFCGDPACERLGCQKVTPRWFAATKDKPLGQLEPPALRSLQVQEQFAMDWNASLSQAEPSGESVPAPASVGVCPNCKAQTFTPRVEIKITQAIRNEAAQFSAVAQKYVKNPEPIAIEQRSNQEWRTLGRVATIIVSKLLGDADLHKGFGRRKFDVRFAGVDIDVRYADRWNADLLASSARPLYGDIAILVVPSGDERVVVTGWIDVSEFERIAQPAPYIKDDPIPNVVTQSFLRGMDKFCVHCETISERVVE